MNMIDLAFFFCCVCQRIDGQPKYKIKPSGDSFLKMAECDQSSPGEVVVDIEDNLLLQRGTRHAASMGQGPIIINLRTTINCHCKELALRAT